MEQLSFPFMDNKPHHNQDRVLTIRLTITDPQKAEKWLFSHKNNPELGVWISASSNGDMFESHDLLEKALAAVEEKTGDPTGIIEMTFDKIEKINEEGLF